MFAVEIEAKIRDGKIEVAIPEEYKQTFSEGVAVKLIVQKQEKKISKTGIRGELVQNPESVPGLRKMSRDELHKR